MGNRSWKMGLDKMFSDTHKHNSAVHTGYPDQAGYFRFENEPNKIYNLFDAGNHMWGYWMGQNQWSLKAALRGANINEGGDDTKADQEAIKNGFNYFIGGAGGSW